MKRLAFMLLLAITGCASAQQPDTAVGQDRQGIDLNLASTEGGIAVRITNTGDREIALQNTNGLSSLPDEPGFEFEIEDAVGKAYIMCGMIEPSVSDNRVVVRKGGSTQVEFSHAFISRVYCLRPGAYTLRAILHLPVNRSGVHQQTVTSNVSPVTFAPD